MVLKPVFMRDLPGNNGTLLFTALTCPATCTLPFHTALFYLVWLCMPLAMMVLIVSGVIDHLKNLFCKLSQMVTIV